MRNERSASSVATGKVAAFRKPGAAPPDSAAGYPEAVEADVDPMLAFASETEADPAQRASRVAKPKPKRAPDSRPRWTPTFFQMLIAAVVLGQLGLLGVWMTRRAQDSGAAGAAGAESVAAVAEAAPVAVSDTPAASPPSAPPRAPAPLAPAPLARAPVAAAPLSSAPVAPVAPAARAAPASRFASGWLSIRSPITAQIFENGNLLGSTDTRYLSLSAGRHNIELVNNALGYREHHTVEINASQITSIALDMPRGTVHITALPWAEVWIDGAHIGDTPLANLSLPIGTHQIVFRHPQYGSQRRLIVLGTTETLRVGVDLRKTP